MAFNIDFTDKVERYSLGVKDDSDVYFLSIPVSNSLADYLEYYAIDKAQYVEFLNDKNKAAEFAKRCKARLEDGKLIYKPGRDRGIAT